MYLKKAFAVSYVVSEGRLTSNCDRGSAFLKVSWRYGLIANRISLWTWNESNWSIRKVISQHCNQILKKKLVYYEHTVYTFF